MEFDILPYIIDVWCQFDRVHQINYSQQKHVSLQRNKPTPIENWRERVNEQIMRMFEIHFHFWIALNYVRRFTLFTMQM